MTEAIHNGNGLRRQILAWHRRVGLAVSAVVLFIVVTGIALNHVGGLDLARKLVANDAVLNWYGMGTQGGPVSYRVGANWLTWVQGSIYLNDRQLDETAAAVIGAVAVDAYIVVAAPQALFVFTKGGDFVEKLSVVGIPGLIEAIGVAGGDRIMLRMSAGTFSAGADFFDWTPSATPVDWVGPAPPPSNLEAAILKAHRGRGLPWSRLLLDIHTGRILGAWGPYLVDAAAVALLILAGTGIYNWVGRE